MWSIFIRGDVLDRCHVSAGVEPHLSVAAKAEPALATLCAEVHGATHTRRRESIQVGGGAPAPGVDDRDGFPCARQRGRSQVKSLQHTCKKRVGASVVPRPSPYSQRFMG